MVLEMFSPLVSTTHVHWAPACQAESDSLNRLWVISFSDQTDSVNPTCPSPSTIQKMRISDETTPVAMQMNKVVPPSLSEDETSSTEIVSLSGTDKHHSCKLGNSVLECYNFRT